MRRNGVGKCMSQALDNMSLHSLPLISRKWWRLFLECKFSQWFCFCDAKQSGIYMTLYQWRAFPMSGHFSGLGSWCLPVVYLCDLWSISAYGQRGFQFTDFEHTFDMVIHVVSASFTRSLIAHVTGWGLWSRWIISLWARSIVKTREGGWLSSIISAVSGVLISSLGPTVTV